MLLCYFIFADAWVSWVVLADTAKIARHWMPKHTCDLVLISLKGIVLLIIIILMSLFVEMIAQKMKWLLPFWANYTSSPFWFLIYSSVPVMFLEHKLDSPCSLSYGWNMCFEDYWVLPLIFGYLVVECLSLQ